MKTKQLTVSLELAPIPNKQELHKVYIRITEHRKHKRIDTGLSLKRNQFKSDASHGTWVRKHPDTSLYNDILDQRLREARNLLGITNANKEFINKEIVAGSLQKKEASKDFLLFWDKKVEQMLNYNQSKGYISTKTKHLLPFFDQLGYSSVDFRMITPSLLVDLENALRKKNLDTDSIYSHLKRIRAIFNRAIAEGVIDPSVYPFRAYKMPKITVNRKERLNEDEVKRFSEVNLERSTLSFNVQQSWMLSFYCAGIRAEDLLTLKVKNIVEGRLMYRMNKTGAMKSIKITENIKNILDHFITTNSKPNDYILPFMPIESDLLEKNGRQFKGLISSKTSLLNHYLKKIGIEAKIDKPITNHLARHSFANIARKKTNDVHAIKSALGHSSIKITEMYLDSLDEDGLDSMMNSVFNEEEVLYG